MRLVLLHYHILKNGGSSIEEMLRASFWERWHGIDNPAHDAEVKSADLVSFVEQNPLAEAVSSHQIFYPVPKAPGYLFFDICFLRDPIDRIRSIYDYFRERSSEDDPIRQLAAQSTLKDFTRRLIDEMPWMVNDVQVNLLANGIVNDQPHGPQDLEAATQRIAEICFLGVVDLFPESLVAGRHRLSVLFPTLDCSLAWVNISAQERNTLAERRERFREACGDDLYSELLQLNAMDLELMDRARAEVRRRLELVPDGQVQLERLNAAATPTPETRRESRPQQFPLDTPRPPLLTRLARAARFASNIRASRPGSVFRRVFDADYYRELYPDVARSGANPLWHFVTVGAFEGRNPNPLFNTKFYLGQSKQLPRADALSDFLQRGCAQGLRPHPLFDSVYYLQRYPEVGRAGVNPLVHYLTHGTSEKRKPNPIFDPDYYVKVCPDAEGQNPLIHFAARDPEHCANPHPLFDCQAYRRAQGENTGNALASYLTRGPNPSVPGSAEPAAFDAAQFSIREVEVLVVFPGPGFAQLAESEQSRIFSALRSAAAREGFSSEVAVVWRTDHEKKFVCAPQQRRFVECVPFDQLAAQINRRIEIRGAGGSNSMEALQNVAR